MAGLLCLALVAGLLCLALVAGLPCLALVIQEPPVAAGHKAILEREALVDLQDPR